MTPVVLVLILHSGKGLVLLELPSAFHMTEQETILLSCLEFLLSVCKFILSCLSAGLGLNEPQQDI